MSLRNVLIDDVPSQEVVIHNNPPEGTLDQELRSEVPVLKVSFSDTAEDDVGLESLQQEEENRNRGSEPVNVHILTHGARERAIVGAINDALEDPDNTYVVLPVKGDGDADDVVEQEEDLLDGDPEGIKTPESSEFEHLGVAVVTSNEALVELLKKRFTP